MDGTRVDGTFGVDGTFVQNVRRNLFAGGGLWKVNQLGVPKKEGEMSRSSKITSRCRRKNPWRIKLEKVAG